MIIKRLELQGFKSFPEKTKIVFHPGITAIVGPNGTGKSNIVDALLWVLGGKRARAARGERGTEIIFNGNQNKAPMSMADVTLCLGDDTEELKIHHRYFRSGEGEYRMNGKSVRLKDIQDSLWKHAIGEKEYFVIEQGAIGQFLSSKPLEKRMLLEEAAGTAYYKEKKRQAQNKLENSEQNLTRLEDIIAEVSRAKNSLRRQARAAVRYRKLREKIRRLTALRYRERIRATERLQEEARKAYTQHLDSENRVRMKLQSEEKALNALKKDVWNLEKSLKQGRENLFRLRSRLTALETEKERAAKRIEFLEEKKQSALNLKRELEQDLVLLVKDRQEAEGRRAALKEELETGTMSLEKAQKRALTLTGELETQRRKIEDLRNKRLEHLAEHTEWRNDRARKEKERELLMRQVEKLRQRLEEESALREKKERELGSTEEELSRLQSEMEAFARKEKTSEKALQEALEKEAACKRDIAAHADEKQKILQEREALDKLEQAQRRAAFPAEVPGALGILADMIEAETSCAPLIDVFWKDETTASLVEAETFLKNLSEKGIKGNVLLLHPRGLEEERPPEPLDDPRVIGHLRSSIRPRKHASGRLARLPDAAIVKDIKTAVELWVTHPSSHYVTLEGDVLLASGLLRSAQKHTGLLTLKREKKSLEKKIAALEAGIVPLQRRFEEAARLRSQLESRIHKAREQARALRERAEEAEKRRLLQKAEAENLAAHTLLIEKEIRVLEADRKRLDDGLIALEDKLGRVEDQEKLMEQTLQKEEKILAAVRERRQKAEQALYKARSDAGLLKEKIAALDERISSLWKRQENVEAKTRDLENNVRVSDVDIQKWSERIADLEKEAKILKQELRKEEAQRSEEEARLLEHQRALKEHEARIEDLRQEAESRKEDRVKWEVKKAERERDLVNLEESCWQDLKKTLEEVKKEIPLSDVPEESLEDTLGEAREQLQKFKAVNLMAEEEYEIHRKRYEFLVKERQDLRESISSTREAIARIDRESRSQFLKAFSEVNKNFQELFGLLFHGGQAEVRLTDPDHPLESGIEIVAQPPGKKIQSLNLLSGGERALTSLAFFFALFRTKPTPFCVLDEVDAALDEVNLTRFLDLMKRVKQQTQFILITHNFKTMEVADYIYGTTMAEPNITNLYAVKLSRKEASPR